MDILVEVLEFFYFLVVMEILYLYFLVIEYFNNIRGLF